MEDSNDEDKPVAPAIKAQKSKKDRKKKKDEELEEAQRELEEMNMNEHNFDEIKNESKNRNAKLKVNKKDKKVSNFLHFNINQ